MPDGDSMSESNNQQSSDERIDLEAQKRKQSTTPIGKRKRCPNCGDLGPGPKSKSDPQKRRRRGKYYCTGCGEHFDTPTVGGRKNPDQRWYTSTDLERAVLDTISSAGGSIRQSEIVEQVDWSAGSVSRVLSNLEGRGSISRTRVGDPDVGHPRPKLVELESGGELSDSGADLSGGDANE